MLLRKISVIVPVYNVEQFLSECVDSILNQTYSDFELILVDDGSPDNCGKICDEYAQKYDRITVIHQENRGLSGARNTGIKYAVEKGLSKWITFIDSDDYVSANYLELLLQAAEVNNVLLSYCDLTATETRDIKQCSTKPPHSKTIESRDWLFLHYTDYVGAFACGKLFDISLFDDIEFPIGKNYEDEAIIPIIISKLDKISFCESELYYYYQRSDSIVSSKPSTKKIISVKFAFDNCERYFFSRNYYEIIPYLNFNRTIELSTLLIEAIKKDCTEVIPKELSGKTEEIFDFKTIICSIDVLNKVNCLFNKREYFKCAIDCCYNALMEIYCFSPYKSTREYARKSLKKLLVIATNHGVYDIKKNTAKYKIVFPLKCKIIKIKKSLDYRNVVKRL